MTVGELIEQLKTFDPPLRVVVNMDYNELANGKEAISIKQMNATRWHGRGAWMADPWAEDPTWCEGEERSPVVNITGGTP